MLEGSENIDQAISYIERATRLRPQLVEGFYYLGKSLEKSNPEEAISYFKHFKKVATGNPEYKGYLSEVKKKIISYELKASQNQRSAR
jgi:tetratricopeptide (TPR) repeat protein